MLVTTTCGNETSRMQGVEAMVMPAVRSAGFLAAGRKLAWVPLSAFLAAIAGCGSNAEPAMCPNLPIATGVLGQTNLNTGTANFGGIDPATVAAPYGALATDGELSYLADTANNRVLGYFSPPSGAGAEADFELGQGDASGSDFTGRAPGTGPTALSAPSKAWVSADGRLVVADTGNNRVLIWNLLPTANTPPDVVVGQPDFNSSRANQMLAAPTAATLRNPTAAVIANGYLIVADQGNNRVLIWNSVPTTANASADVELGQTAIREDDDITTQCTANSDDLGFCFGTAVSGGDEDAEDGLRVGMSAPSDVWSDGFKVLVSDTGNNRVLYWNQIPFTNNTAYTFVMGQAEPAQNEAGIDSQHMDTPWGVYANGTAVYVGDSGNNRVLVFDGFPFQNGQPATSLFGQADFAHSAANDSDQNGVPGSQQNNRTELAPTFNTLSFPTGVYVTSDGKLYVADHANNRIVTFSASSAVTGTVPSLCNGTNPRVE